MFKKEEKHMTEDEALRYLPHNRKEVFFDLLKHRKMTLFALSCYVFMFFIPLAIDLIVFNFLEAGALMNDKDEYLFSLVFYSMLIMLPCMMVGFIGFAGGFYVLKKLVWQEGVNLAVDFFNGVKDGFKHALINGFIFGVALFGFIVGGSYLIILAPTSPVWCGIGIGALSLVLIMLGMVICLFFTQDVYYTNPYFATFKNAFSFLGLLNWKVFLIFLLSSGAVIIMGCINMVTLMVGLFLFAFFNAIPITLYTLISHAAFDKYINQEHYPEMVNKGLYKEETKED